MAVGDVAGILEELKFKVIIIFLILFDFLNFFNFFTFFNFLKN